MRSTMIALALLLLLACPHHGSRGGTPARPGARGGLRQRFQGLLEKSRQSLSWLSNARGIVDESPALQEMIALGPGCLPHVMREVRKKSPDQLQLMWVAADVMKVSPGRADTRSEESFHAWLTAKMTNGPQWASSEFTTLRRKWFDMKRQAGTTELWHDVTLLDPEFRSLRTRRQFTPLGKIYADIQGLGVFVLPLLVQELEKGEYDFLPVIKHLTSGAARVYGGRAASSAKVCIAWWAKHRREWTVVRPEGGPEPAQPDKAEP